MSQVTTKAMHAETNQNMALKSLPCINCPNPGKNKLHNAAMTLPDEPFDINIPLN